MTPQRMCSLIWSPWTLFSNDPSTLTRNTSFRLTQFSLFYDVSHEYVCTLLGGPISRLMLSVKPPVYHYCRIMILYQTHTLYSKESYGFPVATLRYSSV